MESEIFGMGWERKVIERLGLKSLCKSTIRSFKTN